ncbi:hypothetical protein [Cystobacter ferrugineus]|uniref:Hint domain-containing protein n=1 Tax=Cystobacter ferrugineus TaxID=83449 RepID=A0A1L9B2G9_9BACT|nr:hypothetical protein [Cystobacter ferrugineus]OJH36461.1 hypothetical protein BON30_32365 [Cystobacter ferrugineus]
MKNSGFTLTVWLGMTLSTLGCGDATGVVEADELKSNAQTLEALRPIEDVEQLPEDPGGGGGGGVPTTGTPMSLATFQALGAQSDASLRCTGAIGPDACQAELAYGLSINLITLAAYNWGLANGYYPVIDRHNNIGAVCKCGCFEANALILTRDEQGTTAWVPAKDIKTSTTLFALNEAATLSRPTFDAKSIKSATRGEEKPALYAFELDNDRTLKVTQNHGMLLSDGRVVEARTLGVGAEFVALDGSTVRVRDLRFEHTAEDVYNFEVSAQDPAGHIIAAEGVLVGDLAWQNQLSRELGSIAVRR